ncbi:centrosomal AT-AC splicing factor isoform X2 [Hyla sarda]|uniref:centrosomal AT-AC splicing factor isoform X2 n=1 Tax=Hyla sarda TaxID=327740 RepID=UPI0024C30602|nr:centrosomal AT-AC splicing factor isoform X2 [Hyla sarda]
MILWMGVAERDLWAAAVASRSRLVVMSVYECAVCRRTVFSGRRKHVYEKGHQQRLAEVLRVFSEKVEAARKMIKGAKVLKFDPQEHDQKFWCHCCEEEVQKHTNDGNLTVLFGGMLEHMYRPEHIKAVNKYWWTHHGEVKLKARFVLTQDEYERFKSSVTKALDSYEETENILVKQIASQIREAEQARMEMLKAVQEPETQLNGGEDDTWSNGEQGPCSITSIADFDKPGPSNQYLFPNEAVMADATSLTFIGQQVLSNKGNVHTGALPPWMLPDEEESGNAQDIGPSMEGFLKHKEKMTLKKLPPNRVGANFDHNASTDEGWLPSFGRVWNSGRRWQSRHQYRNEAGEKGAKRKRTRTEHS